MLNRSEKEAAVQVLAEELEGIGVIILSDFSGMDVETATEIRRRFREASVKYRVVKNTLARRALEQSGLSELAGRMTGPNAMVLAEDDPVAPAKILVEYEKKNETPKIRLGWVESVLMDAADIRKLADLPSREVLLAQIIGGFQAPVAGFARVLHGLTQKLVATFDAVAKQKAEA